MLSPVLITPPAGKALDISEVRQHVRAPESSDDDPYLEALIDVATAYLEGPNGFLGGRWLLTQTWRADYDAFTDACGGPLRLPFEPVQSIVSMAYYDASNAAQTVPSTTYRLVRDTYGAWVDLAYGQTWPANGVAGRSDAVGVTFKVGFGDTAADIPTHIRQAMLLMIGSWYRDRENEVLGESILEIPLGAKTLLMTHTTWAC